jgi:UDP-2-acetamido-2-deoxy-ribo-hexuluronate aminotransferase
MMVYSATDHRRSHAKKSLFILHNNVNLNINKMNAIQMVDLKTQYQHIKSEIDVAIQDVIDQTAFINGPHVKKFSNELATYLGCKNVIPCANGTDSLQIALMALGLKPGDEVIVPSFTYVATAEVIALLQLIPIMVDVEADYFGIDINQVEKAITTKTKAIVPVHLYGQSADMEAIMELANKNNLFVIEDTAQAIGGDYTFADGHTQKLGTIGHIGSTSFFPSKNLGCYGDGGALYTNDDELAKKMYMIANHGQSIKYQHDVIGCNSRLDSIQAAILSVKLKHLDKYCKARQEVANIYDKAFVDINGLIIPKRFSKSSHVFHQYTLQIKEGRRDALKEYLESHGVPSMIYYPIALYNQAAFKPFAPKDINHPIADRLCTEVLSLPIHTEMKPEDQEYIIDKVKAFFQ